jgi:hypothetical protein
MNSKLFLNQTNDFIWYLLYPNSRETQTEMNIDAYETFQKSENELSQLILIIKEAKKEDTDMMFLNIELFDQTIEEWKKYRDIKAKFDASIVEGGSMYSMIYSDSLTTTTKEKIESLQNEYAIDLRRYAIR